MGLMKRMKVWGVLIAGVGVVLALAGCAGLRLQVSTDEAGNVTVGGTIPAVEAEK